MGRYTFYESMLNIMDMIFIQNIFCCNICMIGKNILYLIINTRYKYNFFFTLINLNLFYNLYISILEEKRLQTDKSINERIDSWMGKFKIQKGFLFL